MKHIIIIVSAFACLHASAQTVKQKSDGSLIYTADEKGNVIPDFSKVGFYANTKSIPTVPVVKILAAENNNDQQRIQNAIDDIAKTPLDENGYRGALLLKKGTYRIPGTIKITASGIVIRGEGIETKLVAVGKGQRDLISVAGKGEIKQIGERVKIIDHYVPLGVKSFNISSASHFAVGDHIIVFRPGTEKWIHDLKMDQIDQKDSTIKQWQPKEYDMLFERIITKIEGNRISIDNSIVMAMEDQYGGGEIFKYEFAGRINNIGVENLYCESEFASDTDEDHGWNAIHFNRTENGWVRNITARFFGYSCVNLGNLAKQITVDSCSYLQPKSQIIGGRRYSFNNDGQLNLIQHCFASEGRHDYVTGAKVCGPNVFYNCRSENTKADIGAHHRWAMGTLFDNVITDGEINVQDRGNWGTGHGWAGVNQIIWNCVAGKAAVQDPWVAGKNYVFGLQAKRDEGRLKGRPQTIWNEAPFRSLYESQTNLMIR